MGRWSRGAWMELCPSPVLRGSRWDSIFPTFCLLRPGERDLLGTCHTLQRGFYSGFGLQLWSNSSKAGGAMGVQSEY